MTKDVPLIMIEKGTPGKLLGYNGSGEVTELDAPTFDIDSLPTITTAAGSDLMVISDGGIESGITINNLAALIESLITNIPPTGFGDVGTYVLAEFITDGVNVLAGDTVSGSQLNASGFTNAGGSGPNDAQFNTEGTSFSGTWRNMGAQLVSTGGVDEVHLFMRIA